jgi:hypothetical protein
MKKMKVTITRQTRLSAHIVVSSCSKSKATSTRRPMRLAPMCQM